MNRHLSRIVVVQALFEWDFRDQENLDAIVERGIENYKEVDKDFIYDAIKGIVHDVKKIDDSIIKVAPDWPIDQVSNIDKAILRLAIFELLFAKNPVPPKVAINEAVELGKAFGSENSPKFINGVLGTLYRTSDRYNPEDDVKVLVSEDDLKDLTKEEKPKPKEGVEL